MIEHLEHIKYIIDNYSSELLARLKSEKLDTTVIDAIDVFLACDPSQDKKLTDWLVKTYCFKGFRWEDVEAGEESKLAEVLGLYQTHFSKIPRDQRNIYLYQSYGELYHFIEPYLIKHSSEETLGSREIRRRERARALEESEVLYRSEDMIVAVPLTQSAAVWWGRGTKWCTAADKNNYFNHYNRDAPLIIITLLNPAVQQDSMNLGSSDQSIDSSERNAYSSGSVEKFQLWASDSDIQFMDAQDCVVDSDWIESNWRFIEPIINHLIEWNGRMITYVPFQHLTVDLCIRCILQSRLNFNFIPQDFLTDDLCILAVSRNGELLRRIPDRLITAKICRLAVENNPHAILFVPKRFKTFELCKEAVSRNGALLRYLSENFQIPEFFGLAVEQNGNLLRDVPEQFKTLDICKAAIKQNGQAIVYVPEQFKTAEMYASAVASNALALSFIPDALKTKELCKKAVEQNGGALESVPDRFITSEICRIAVEQHALVILSIPKRYQNYELLKLAVTKNPRAITYMSANLRLAELCKIAIEQDGLLLRDIPEKLITPEFCRIATEQNAAALQFVPDLLKTAEICKSCVEFNGLMIMHTPARFFTEEIYKIAIEQNPGVISFIPEEFITDELLSGGVKNMDVEWNKSILKGLQESISTHKFSNESQPQPTL